MVTLLLTPTSSVPPFPSRVLRRMRVLGCRVFFGATGVLFARFVVLDVGVSALGVLDRLAALAVRVDIVFCGVFFS